MSTETKDEKCRRCGKTARELGDPFLLGERCWCCEIAHRDERTAVEALILTELAGPGGIGMSRLRARLAKLRVVDLGLVSEALVELERNDAIDLYVERTPGVRIAELRGWIYRRKEKR